MNENRENDRLHIKSRKKARLKRVFEVGGGGGGGGFHGTRMQGKNVAQMKMSNLRGADNRGKSIEMDALSTRQRIAKSGKWKASSVKVERKVNTKKKWLKKGPHGLFHWKERRCFKRGEKQAAAGGL